MISPEFIGLFDLNGSEMAFINVFNKNEFIVSNKIELRFKLVIEDEHEHCFDSRIELDGIYMKLVGFNNHSKSFFGKDNPEAIGKNNDIFCFQFSLYTTSENWQAAALKRILINVRTKEQNEEMWSRRKTFADRPTAKFYNVVLNEQDEYVTSANFFKQL